MTNEYRCDPTLTGVSSVEHQSFSLQAVLFSSLFAFWTLECVSFSTCRGQKNQVPSSAGLCLLCGSSTRVKAVGICVGNSPDSLHIWSGAFPPGTKCSVSIGLSTMTSPTQSATPSHTEGALTPGAVLVPLLLPCFGTMTQPETLGLWSPPSPPPISSPGLK